MAETTSSSASEATPLGSPDASAVGTVAQSKISFSIFDEISDCLKWAHDRAAPLTFVGLALANIFLLDFLIEFHIPISFFSPGLLTALPALFIMITFVAILLVSCWMMPAVVLLAPVTKDGPSLIGSKLHLSCTEGDGPNRPDAWRRWVWLTVAIGMLWICMFPVALYLPFVPPWGVLIVIVFLSLLFGWYLLRPIMVATGSRPSQSFKILLFAAIVLQNCVVFGVLYTSLWFMQNAHGQSWVTGGMVYLITIMVVSGGQLVVAHQVDERPLYSGVLVHSIIIVMGLLGFIAIIPPVGGLVAAVPLKSFGSGMRSCVVLTLLPTEGDQRSITVPRDVKNPSQTIPMKFVVQLDGAYYLKTEPFADHVYLIPGKQVDGIKSCPPLQ